MHQLLLTGAVLASFLGGVVALLAPCCVSVMLPAYFAVVFQRRVRVAAMTLVFAVGVGTVILPIGLGATALSRLLAGHHFAVFSVMGLAMSFGGAAMMLGWKLMLPMPGPGRTGSGVSGVYFLGVFSGAASACCAPVLAGVAAVSGAVASFPVALGLGVTYVFGMVAPLCLLALLWDRRDWGSSRVFTVAKKPVRVIGRPVPLSSLLSGGLLTVMGALTVVFAFTGPNLGTAGWQVQVTAFLDHAAAVVRRGVGWLPNWLTALLVLSALVSVVWLAIRRRPDREEIEYDDLIAMTEKEPIE